MMTIPSSPPAATATCVLNANHDNKSMDNENTNDRKDHPEEQQEKEIIITELKSRVQNLEEENSRLEEKLSDGEKKISTLTMDLEASNKLLHLIDEVSSSRLILSQQVASATIEKETELIISENDFLFQQVQSLQAENERLMERIDAAGRRDQLFMDEMATLKQRNAFLARQVSDFEERQASREQEEEERKSSSSNENPYAVNAFLDLL